MFFALTYFAWADIASRFHARCSVHDVLQGEKRTWPATEEGVTGSKESKMSTMSKKKGGLSHTNCVCPKIVPLSQNVDFLSGNKFFTHNPTFQSVFFKKSV